MGYDDRIGRMVADRYRLDSILGRGGMGVVYAGTHTWTERPVAVKLLLPIYAEDSRLLERFFQEAKTAAGLRHPNVVDVLDMGEDDDGAAFLVLERLEGEELGDRLEREGALSVSEALTLLLPVMEALEAAHERGIVHRDLKPANIFLSRGHKDALVPKLLDFGVAKLLDGGSIATRTGSMMGTPAYMSPEQIRGDKDLDGSADVWGMGALLFRVISGVMPVPPNPNPTMMVLEVVSKPRPKLLDVKADLPKHVAEVIDGALLRERSERHRTMQAFREALEGAAAADGIELQ